MRVELEAYYMWLQGARTCDVIVFIIILYTSVCIVITLTAKFVGRLNCETAESHGELFVNINQNPLPYSEVFD